MKRLVIYLFITMGVTSVQALEYSGGSGTAEDPYQIATAQDLVDLGQTTADYDKSFILIADIDLSDLIFDRAVIVADTDDNASGFQGTIFTGCFNGQGHVIRHLRIQGQDYLGLFGRIDGRVKITNLGLEAVDISGNGYVGGLAGINYGSISSSYSTGTVSAEDNVGGLVGYNWSTNISSSYSTCTVSGENNVGGLVGYNGSSTISSSYSSGTINGKNHVGGLVGYNGYSTIWSSYSIGTVSGSYCVGGLVGYNGSSTIWSSYSTGMVSGTSYVGGLVGNASSGSILSSFWDTETSGMMQSAGGTGLSTAAMQYLNTYMDAGWDFADNNADGTCNFWLFQEGAYPTLAVFSGLAPIEPNGAGTREDPYLITTAAELGSIWYRPHAHYQLASDIDLAGITWGMTVAPWFSGSFDGNHYSIRSLHIQRAVYLNLFGTLEYSAKITNLHLEDMFIEGVDD